MKKILTLSFLLSLVVLSASAQEEDSATTTVTAQSTLSLRSKAPIRKPYWGNSLDGMIFSTALIDHNGDKSLGTLRFSMFLHIGGTYNYNFNNNVAVYTGLDLKNIGFIEKFKAFNNLTIKRRVYTLGIPVGLRLGNMKTRDYFFLGGGLDVAFHYKEKSWSSIYRKSKYREWFSDQTQILMPYIFAGVAYKGTTLKIQYYPGNFFNQDFKAYDIGHNVIKPYTGTKVNLLLVSIGRDMKFGRGK